MDLAAASMTRLRDTFDETVNLGVMRMERVVDTDQLETILDQVRDDL